MSEARAVTNFSGNAVATLLIGTWTNTIDRHKVDAVLRGDDPFDELSMVDDVRPTDGQTAVPQPREIAAA
jgi:aerobic C4-dicarboxylate transport protein